MTGHPLTVGFAGATGHACVAVVAPPVEIGVCEQQRVTRSRDARSSATGLPEEALDLLLRRSGHTRADVDRYATTEAGPETIAGRAVERLDHHLAHACTAFLTSPFSSATIVVCDHELPKVSVWRGRANSLTPLDWRWEGTGFSDLFAACGQLLGFAPGAGEQRLEALARLAPGHRDELFDALFSGDGHSLRVKPSWQAVVEQAVIAAKTSGHMSALARIAASLQGRIAELFLEFLQGVREETEDENLCLGGGLFYHSSINTVAKQSALFAGVFAPVDPGNSGLPVGAALYVNQSEPQLLSPFLGPSYDSAEIKATLDNCKLRYDWKSDDQVIDMAVAALQRGHLIGWFEGSMEWGPRALGARSILANPLSPYVLENLNVFLKQRETWRGYALSAIDARVPACFDGPHQAPFMECDYRPRDVFRFRHVLPGGNGSLRVHTVDRRSPPRFRRLLEAFEAATGIPCLVNTSFNGFHEPIVCSPRDAVRVFYGSGVDMLAIEQFVLSK